MRIIKGKKYDKFSNDLEEIDNLGLGNINTFKQHIINLREKDKTHTGKAKSIVAQTAKKD